MQPWIDLLRVVLLPALSASEPTSGLEAEIWRILRMFPYAVRYGLYDEWRHRAAGANGIFPCPIAARCAAKTTRDARRVLSRITAPPSGSPRNTPTSQPDQRFASDMRDMSRSNPCALWDVVIHQVKAYPNIGQHVLGAAQLMSPFSIDVATYTLIGALSDDDLSRENAQGTGDAAWLNSESVCSTK